MLLSWIRYHVATPRGGGEGVGSLDRLIIFAIVSVPFQCDPIYSRVFTIIFNWQFTLTYNKTETLAVMTQVQQLD